jgi:hypothetical protein
MDSTTGAPVFSAHDLVEVVPEGSPRSFTVAPLTYRERQAFRADHAREGGIYPTREQVLEALRQAVRAAAPSNATALLAVIDAAEADTDGEDTAAQAALAVIEATLSDDPGYAALLAARRRWLGMLPWCAARHSLRGWSGANLPPFRRERGAVPVDLMDLLPDAEVEAIGLRALALLRPDQATEGNSVPHSPAPASPTPLPVG